MDFLKSDFYFIRKRKINRKIGNNIYTKCQRVFSHLHFNCKRIMKTYIGLCKINNHRNTWGTVSYSFNEVSL